MKYHHLPFEEYFINTSEDYTHTGKVTYPVKYVAVKYNLTRIGKLFRLAHEVNYEMHYEPDRDVIQIHFQRTMGRAASASGAPRMGKYVSGHQASGPR